MTQLREAWLDNCGKHAKPSNVARAPEVCVWGKGRPIPFLA